MAEGLVLRPPERASVEGPVVCLAGPVRDAPLWQPEAIDLIQWLDSSLHIASPRLRAGNKLLDPTDHEDWVIEQRKRAENCGAVMFWLANAANKTPRTAYAQRSIIELDDALGRHLQKGIKLAVGIDPDFKQDIAIRKAIARTCPDLAIYDSLPDSCKAVVGLFP